MSFRKIAFFAWIIMAVIGALIQINPIAIALCVVMANTWLAVAEIIDELKK